MNSTLEELDFQSTTLGNLILRRRQIPYYGNKDIYEIKLGEDFLMTSLFHEAESELAHLGIEKLGLVDESASRA